MSYFVAAITGICLFTPVSMTEIVLGYVGAAAAKGMLIGIIILGTTSLFVDLSIAHPLVMLLLFILTAVTFSLFGFINGIRAKDFEPLNLIPVLVIPPLVFFGGSLYSIDMLPPF
jgi:ABC-2 type transport system permease protein